MASTQTQPTAGRDGTKQAEPKSPTYVAPIPRIGSIGDGDGLGGISTSNRPQLPPGAGDGLVGKVVDEHGDIVDPTTGRVCGRAGGDLPAMVGRRVANNRGDVLGDDGELLGYVADVEPPAGGPGPRSLRDVLGRSSASLMVDHVGNILDAEGNVVGKFHDNNNPLHREQREQRDQRDQREQQEQAAAAAAAAAAEACGSEEDGQSSTAEAGRDFEDAEPQEHSSPSEPPPRPRPRRTESQRRQNAEAWRKEKPGESPSDIFLDVKSTTEGIQLTVRIPTVFANGQAVRPHVSFS